MKRKNVRARQARAWERHEAKRLRKGRDQSQDPAQVNDLPDEKQMPGSAQPSSEGSSRG